MVNYYNPKRQDATSMHTSSRSKRSSNNIILATTSGQASRSTLHPTNSQVRKTEVVDITSSTSPQRPQVTRLVLAPSDAASHLQDIIPFTTTAYTDDEIVHPSFPGPHDITKPVLEITCVDRTRLFWSDFKITWSTTWNDQRGCRKLFHAMNRRGLVTGWRCKQAGNENMEYIMQAVGHRPRSPRSLVADAIREVFQDVRINLLACSAESEETTD